MNALNLWPYQSAGNPHNPPLIFLHGFMGRGRDWLPLVPHLMDRFYCLLPDLPGHGNNINLPQSTQLTYDNVVKGLIYFCDQLSLQHFNLIGYSMGGRIALYTATQFPDRISSLTLESANPGLTDQQARQARATLDDERAERLLHRGLNVFVDHWYELALFSSLKQHPLLFAQTRLKRKQSDPRWMAKVISELSPGRQLPLWDKLGELPMPVLLLAGALDTKYVDLIEKMGEQIPQATVKIIPNAGHNIHLEQQNTFIDVLATYLSKST